MRFKKTKTIHTLRPAPAAPHQLSDEEILLTANAHVLSTEDKNKFVALYRHYLDEYQPHGPTQHDLVEEMVAAKWRQRRCAFIETGILNLTMDKMADQVARDFAAIPNAIRTAVAYMEQCGQDRALAQISRDEARHIRSFHRALRLLREIQSLDRQGADTPAAPNQKMQNEPNPRPTPAFSIVQPGRRPPGEPPEEPPAGPQGGPQ